MAKIRTKNFKGTEFQGEWNGKAYKSNIKEQSNLKRIYIDNQAIHVTPEELSKIYENDEILKAKNLKAEQDKLYSDIMKQDIKFKRILLYKLAMHIDDDEVEVCENSNEITELLESDEIYDYKAIKLMLV